LLVIPNVLFFLSKTSASPEVLQHVPARTWSEKSVDCAGEPIFMETLP